MDKRILAALLLIFMAGGVITAAPAKKQIKLTKNVAVQPKKSTKNTITSKKEQAAYLLENLRYKEAQPVIEELLAANINDLDTNIYYNTFLINASRLNEAQDNLDELLQKNPNNSDLHFLQGLVYLKRPDSSDMNYRKNSEYYYQSGIEELQKSIELNKNNYKAYNALGVAFLSADNYDAAEENFKEAIKLKTDYATAYDNLGTLYYQQGNYEIAENRFNEAIARNPYCYTAYYHLARMNAKDGEYTTALDMLEKSLLINPNFAYAYNLAGEIYAAQQNEAAAIVNYKKAIELLPEFTTPYLNLAKLYENRADNEFALESLKTIAGMDKNTEAICLKIGDIELAKGSYAQAEKYYSVIGKDSKLYPEALKGLADTYWAEAKDIISNSSVISAEKLYQAREKLDAAIDINPSDVELRLAKLKLDKIIGVERTDKELQAIIASEPHNVAEYIVKGEALCVEGEYVLAKEEYEKALKAATSLDEYKYLAEFFTFNKNYDLALDALNKAELLNPVDRQVLDNRTYVNKKISKSDEYYKDAVYFKKEGDKFFSNKYLKRAVEENPANIDANKLLAKYYKKNKNLKAECACYKQILAASTNEREIKKYTKKVIKLEKKIKRAENKQSFWSRLFG